MRCQIIIRGVRVACATLGLALCAAAPAAPRAADVVDRVERTFAAPAHGLRIDATIADVVITGSSRTDVAIAVTRRAPGRADLDQVPVAIDADGDRIRVSVVQPHDGGNPRLTSEIGVRVPAAVAIEAVRVFEGKVRVNALTDACDVDVRRGSIEAEDVSGRIRLETGIGSIDVKHAALTPGGLLRLRTFDGNVRLQFAAPPQNARVLALTFNGTITSDLELTKKDRFGPRFGETTIGTGEPVVSIDVVTGDIAIAVAGR